MLCIEMCKIMAKLISRATGLYMTILRTVRFNARGDNNIRIQARTNEHAWILIVQIIPGRIIQLLSLAQLLLSIISLTRSKLLSGTGLWIMTDTARL